MSSKRWWESVLDIAEDGLSLTNKAIDLPRSFAGRILQFGADAAHQLFLEQDPQKAINLPGEGEDSRYKPTGPVDLIGAAERGWRALPGNAKTTPQPNRSDDLEVSRATLTESFLNVLTGTYEDAKELYEALPYDEQITKGFSNSSRFVMNLPLESLRAPSGMTTGAVKRQPLNDDGSKKTIGQAISEQALTYNEIYDLFQNVNQFTMLSWNDLEVQARRRQEGNPDTVAEAMGFVERQQHLWNVASTSSIGATITFSLAKVDPTDEVATTRYMLEHPETYNITSGIIDGIFRFVGDPGTRGLRLVKGSTWRNAKRFFTPNPTQSGPPLYTVKGLPKGPANTNVGKEFDIIDLVLDGDGNYSSVLDQHFKPDGNGMSLVKIIKDDADLTRSKLSTAARENNVYSVADEKIYNEGLGTFIENAVRETPIDAAVYGEVLANAPYKTLSTIYRAAVQSSDNESVINVLKLGMADYRQIPLIEEAAVEFGRIAAIITQPNVPENYLDDIDLFALQPMGEGKALPGEPIAASQVGIDSLRQRITYNVQSLQDHIKELNDVVGNREAFLDYLAKEKMPTKQASYNAQEQLAQNDKQYNFLTTSIEGIRATIASAVKDMSKVLTGDVDLLDAERIFKESLNKSAELYGQNVSNYVSNQISWSLPKDAASTVGIVALRNAKNLPFHDAYDMAIKQIENLLRPPETISPGVNDAGLWVRDAVPLDSVVTRTVVNNRALADEQATRELDANGFPVKQIIPQQHNTFREADVVAPVTKDPRTILNDPDQAQNPDVWEAFGGDKPYNQFAYRRGAINLHTARTYPGLIGRIVDSISDAYGPKGTFGSLIGPSMLVGVNDKVQLPAISKAKEIINSVKKSSIPNEAPLSSRNLTAEYFFSEAQDNIIVWKDMSVQNIDKAFRKMILDAEAIKPTISSSTSEIFKSVKKSKDVVTLAGYSKNELIARFVQMNVVEKRALFNEVVKKLFTSIDRIYADVWPMTNEIKLSDQLYLSHKQNEISMQEAYSNNRTQIYGNSDIAYNEIGTNTAGEQVIQVQSFRVNDATSGPISPAQFQTASTIPDFRHINRDIRKILNQQNSAVAEVKVIEALSSLNDVLTMFWKRGKLARFPGYPLLTNLDDAFRSMQQMNILELSSGYFSGLADIRTSAIYRDIRKNSFNPTAVWVQKTKDELQIAFDKLGAEKVKQILNRENVVVQDFGTSKLVEVKALDVQATNIPGNLPGVSLTPDQALDTRVLPENSISFGNLELDHIQLLMVYDKFERLKHVPTQQTIWENVYKEAGYGYASKDLIQKGKIGNQTVRAITGLTIGSLLGGPAGLAATFGGVLAQRSLTRVAQREIALQGLNLQTYAKHLQKSHIDAQVKRYDDSIGIGAVNIYDDSVRSGSNNLNQSLNSLQLTPPWRLDPKNKFDPTNPPLIEGAKEAAEGISLVVPELVGFKTFDNLLDDEIIVQSRTNNVSQQRGVYRRPTPNDVELMRSEELDTIFVYKRDPVTNEQISPAEIKTKTTTVIDEIAYSVLGSMSLQGSTIFLRHLFNRNSDIAKLGALSLFTGHYASTLGPQHLIGTRAFEKQIPFLSNFFKYQNQTNSRRGTQIDDVKNLELDFEMQMREPITSDISVLDQKQLQSFIDTNKAIFELIAPGYDVIDDVTLAFQALAPNSISLDKQGIVSIHDYLRENRINIRDNNLTDAINATYSDLFEPDVMGNELWRDYTRFNSMPESAKNPLISPLSLENTNLVHPVSYYGGPAFDADMGTGVGTQSPKPAPIFDKPIFHGAYKAPQKMESFVDDATGELILKPSSNFEGRQRAVSFSSEIDEAWDYAGRVKGGGGARNTGLVFEINGESIPEDMLNLETSTELEVSFLPGSKANTAGLNEIRIPAEDFRVIHIADKNTIDTVIDKNTKDQTLLQNMSDEELAEGYVRSEERGEVIEKYHNDDGYFDAENIYETEIYRRWESLIFEEANKNVNVINKSFIRDKRVEGLIDRTLNGGKGWEIVSTRTGVNLFDLLYTPKQQAILGLYHFSSVTNSGWAGPHTDKNKYLNNSISKHGSTPNTDADEMMLGLKEYGEKNYIPAENLMPSNWITDKELELLQDHLKGLSNNVLSQVNPGQEFINVYRSGDLIPDNNLDGPISFTLNPMFPGSNLLPWFNPDTSRSLASSKNIQEAFSQPQIMEERLKVLRKELNDLDDELAIPNADWSDEGGRYQARRNISNEINTLEGQHIEAKANYESLRNRYGIRTTQIDEMNFEYNIYDVADEQLRIFGIESKETRLLDRPDGSGQFLPEAPAPITISNLHKKQLDSSGNVLQSLINRFTKKKNAFNDAVAILNDQDLYDPQQRSYRPTLSETNDLDFYSYTVNNVELTAKELLEEALSPGFTGPRYEIIREGITETDYMRSVSNGLADLFQFLAKTAQTKIKAGSENWKITRSGTGSRDIVMGVSEAEEVAILTAIAKGDSSFFTMASQGDTVSKYKVPRNEVDFLLETRVKSNVEDELLIDPLKVTKEYDMMTEVNSEEALIAEIEQLKRAFAISLTGDLQQAKQHAHIMARTRDSYPELYDAADLAGRKQLAAGVQPTAIGSELLPGELGQNPQEWAVSQKVKQDGVWARELYTTQLPNNSQVAQKTTQFTFDMPNGDVVFSAAWDNHINKFMIPLPDGAAMNAFRELPKRVWRGDTAKEIVTYLRSPDAADLMATAPIEWTENTLPIVSRMIREYNSMIPPMLEFAHVRKKAAQGIEVSWKADIEPVLSTMAPSNTVTGIRSPIFNIRENLGHVDFGKVTGSDAFKQLGEQLGISRNLLQKVDNAYDRLFLKSQSAMRDSTHKHHVTKYLENTIAAITPILNPPMSRFIKTYPELAAQWNKDGYGFELNQVLQQSQNNATFSQYQQQPIMTEQLLRLRHERIEQFIDQDYAKRVGLSETFELLKKIKSGSAVTIDKSGNRVDVDVVSLLFPNGLTNIIKEMDVVKQPDSRGPNLEQWIVNDIAMPDRSLQIYTDFLLQTSRGYQPYAEVANEVGLFGGNFEINDTLTNLFVDRPTLNLLQTISKAIEDVSIIRQQINTLSFDHPNIDNPLLSNEIDAQGKIYNDAVLEGLDLAGDPSVPNLSLENANNTQSINYLALLRSSGIDQSQIDGILLKAKQYADTQVKQTLFNMAGKTKFQELFKTIAPFLGAGQEVLTSWTKHTYHDPIRTHKYVRAAIGSTEGEDENGNKRNTIKIPTSIYGLNLENGFGKFSDIAGKQIRANATSLLPINSTKSFNVFGGYYTSVISNEVLLKIPSLERALKMFIPYGLDPEGSMLKRAIKNLGPNWAIIASGKEFKVPGTNITYQANNERFNSTKSWAYDMLMVQHFEAGNEPLNQASLNAIDELSFEIAQNLIIAQAALASASPLPLQIVSPYTDNLNEYWETYKKYGQEIANEELWDTGYFMTTARRTQIVGAASGTQEGNFLFNKFETFIKEWPEIDDWVIGKYGPLGQELEYETSYNKVVVDSEISQGRRKVVSDPKRYYDTKVSMGWNDFNDLLREVDQQWRIEVADYNINNAAVIEANPELERTLSKNQKAFKESTAGLVWQQGLKELTQTNTEWYNEWLDIGNPAVKIRTIQAFREVVKDPDFADRLEMASLKDYMDTRDQITNFMEDMGFAWSTDDDLFNQIRGSWLDFRDSISNPKINSNWIEFAPLYNRYFSDDEELNVNTGVNSVIPRLGIG